MIDDHAVAAVVEVMFVTLHSVPFSERLRLHYATKGPITIDRTMGISLLVGRVDIFRKKSVEDRCNVR